MARRVRSISARSAVGVLFAVAAITAPSDRVAAAVGGLDAGHVDVAAAANWDPPARLLSTIPTLEAVSPLAVTDAMTAVVPARVLDTRVGIGAPVAPLGVGAALNVTVVGVGGIPASGVDAVFLNVTATDTSGSSYLTVWPTGLPRPNASSLNLTPGSTIANLVLAKVGAGGQVSIYNDAGSTQVVADAVGWVPTGSGVNTLVPSRILDSRIGVGAAAGPVGPGGTIDVRVLGVGGVPAAAQQPVSAVLVNVTAAGATAPSFVTVWPTGQARPVASSLNVGPGRTVPNLVLAKVGSDGKISLYNAAGAVDLIADVVGWVHSFSALVPTSPNRVLDTRVDRYFTPGLSSQPTPMRIGRGQAFRLNLGVRGIYASAVLANVTVVNPSAASWVTTYPAGTARPNASSVNFPARRDVPNLVLLRVGNSNSVDFHLDRGTADLIVDVVGVVGGAPLSSPVDPQSVSSTGDLPDEAPGALVHFVYAYASDQAPVAREEAVAGAANATNQWFSAQTDGRLIRFDTSGGRIEVTRLRTSRTKAQMEAGDTIANIRSELSLAGLGGLKAMVVFYEGTTPDGYCGVTSGTLILMPMARCAIYPGSSGWPYDGSYLLAHELTHLLGAVPFCAPHYLGAHAGDSPRDVLYGGPLGRDWAHLELDTNHDDYYLAGIGGCSDVGSAPYFDAGG